MTRATCPKAFALVAFYTSWKSTVVASHPSLVSAVSEIVIQPPVGMRRYSCVARVEWPEAGHVVAELRLQLGLA